MKAQTILLLLNLVAVCSYGQVVVDDRFESVTLENRMKIYSDTSDMLQIEDVLLLEKKLPFKNEAMASPNIGRDLHPNWIVFDIKNTSDEPKSIFLYLSHPFIDFLSVYVVENGQVVQEAAFEYEQKLKRGLVNHLARPAVEIKTKPNTGSKIFVRFRNTGGIMILGMELLSEEAFYETTNDERTLYTIFFSIILAFSVLSMAFFIISKSRIYLYYGLYVIFVAISVIGTIGTLYNASSFKLDFFNGDSCFRFYSILGIVFNVLFLRKFFEIPTGDKRSFYVRFGNVILWLCYIVLFLTVLDIGSIYYAFSSVLNTYVFFVLICIVSVTYNRKRKPETVKLYVFSILPIFTAMVVRILSELNFIETPINFVNAALPALVVEFFILLVGLSKLFIRRVNREKELETKIITSQIETQEAERKHIAQDLHDDLGATLSALKGRNAQDSLSEESQQLLNKAITDLRAISRRLLPADFEAYGFVPSLEKYIADINEQQKLKITLIVFGDLVKLHTEKELNIYRIITELVNNITKHSNAENATVQLVYHADYLFVSVEDDGNEKNKTEYGLGIGLKNVISRLEYLNAKQINGSGQGESYSFMFEIPFTSNL